MEHTQVCDSSLLMWGTRRRKSRILCTAQSRLSQDSFTSGNLIFIEAFKASDAMKLSKWKKLVLGQVLYPRSTRKQELELIGVGSKLGSVTLQDLYSSYLATHHSVLSRPGSYLRCHKAQLGAKVNLWKDNQ